MTDVEQLLKNTVEELDRLLNAKNVLGDPIDKGDSTVIPIVSYGFGFGAGGTQGGKSGDGGGTGAGGGIKPLGAIIIDKEGARVEAIKGAMSSLTDVLGDAATVAVNRVAKGRDTPET